MCNFSAVAEKLHIYSERPILSYSASLLYVCIEKYYCSLIIVVCLSFDAQQKKNFSHA